MAGPGSGSAPSGQRPTWDFETGTLQGWEQTGTAFRFQPTLGDNPTARDRRQPSGHQGRWWIGTFERYRGRRGERPGGVQGDEPQGTLTSAVFTIPSTLSFLVGGGSAFETRVELRVLDPIEGEIRAMFVSGRDSETMRRVRWDLAEWAGRPGRIRIVDASSGGWGHINVDDFRFGQERPPTGDSPPPPPPVELGLEPAAVELAPGEDAAIAVRLSSAAATIFLEPARALRAPVAGVDLGVEWRCVSDAPAVATAAWDDAVCRVTAIEPGETIVRVQATTGPRTAEGAAAVRVLTLVPPLRDLDEAAARDWLRASRLRVGSVSRRASGAAAGTVVDQSPDPGARVPPGSAVGLVLAAPARVEVPFLVGRDDADADARVTAAGLRPGEASSRISLRAGGTVLAQSPAGGALVPPGTRVDRQVAAPRVLWAGPAGVVIVALLGFLGLRTVRRREQPTPEGGTRPDGGLRFRPRSDPGLQTPAIPGDGLRLEIRLQPRPDVGVQEIEIDTEPNE